jgi:hypothetical protein
VNLHFLVTLPVLLAWCLQGIGQPTPFTHLQRIEVRARQVQADPLGQVYWLDDAGVSRMEPATGKVIHYSNRRQGPVSFLDASDPLNILLFYQETGVIEFLDKNLAPKNFHNPMEGWPETGLPSLVCLSRQEGFWAYFPQTMSLKRYDMRFRPRSVARNIGQQLTGFTDPAFMTESQNRLFIKGRNGEVFVFDSFANFLFSIPGVDSSHFQVHGDYLIYFSTNKMHLFNFIKRTETVFLLPHENVVRGFLQGQQLILQTQTGIHRYAIALEIP